MPTKISTPMAGQKMPPKLRLKLANECEDLLAKTKLNTLDKRYKFHLLHSKHLTDEVYSKMMTLFKILMKEMYENTSWGWNEPEKLAEWKHPRTRVVLVTEKDKSDSTNFITFGNLPEDDENIIGFMCFRFEAGADKSECSLYVYELHVDIDHQRQGLGEELMRMSRTLATAFKMDKIMLTVFRSNQPALQFYNKLNFLTDKSSPAKNEADYMILSSKVK